MDADDQLRSPDEYAALAHAALRGPNGDIAGVYATLAVAAALRDAATRPAAPCP